MTFINKVVLITGAASGIGEAIAFNFAKLSARLYLVDINEENLKKTVEKCEKLSKAKVFKANADITNDESLKKVIESVNKEYGRIDVVVNCAGIYGPGRLSDDNIMEVYDKVMAVNLRSIVTITHLVAPALIESKGCIINISSVSAVLTTANTLPYNVAKAALTHFTKTVAFELSTKGVRLNSILPGPVKTNMLIHAGMNQTDSDYFWIDAGKAVPLKHVVKAEEIAELTAFLASDKARSITGANHVIDSGLVLAGSQDPPGFRSN